jgi:hypothetical protein
MLDLPCAYLICWYCFFAALHSSLYHGAMCFSHLLGFLLSVITVLLITSIFTASAIRNSSIFAALRSLSSVNFCTISSNVLVNNAVDVCSFHFRALVLYSSSFSPGIHL